MKTHVDDIADDGNNKFCNKLIYNLIYFVHITSHNIKQVIMKMMILLLLNIDHHVNSLSVVVLNIMCIWKVCIIDINDLSDSIYA